jgi:hypothetical protein
MGLRAACRVLPALLVILLLAACRSEGATVTTDAAGPGAGATNAGVAAENVEVEVDIFSGRPNPTWTLDADSAHRLATLTSHLTPAPAGTAPGDPGLGFRGFLVRGLDLGSLTASPGQGATLRVQGDLVIAAAGDHQSLFTDPGHQMYTMLRDLAIDHVSSDLATHLPVDGLAS